MPEISIELTDADELQFDVRAYPPRADRILVRALNRGINSGRTFMQREIARDTGLRVGDARAAIVMREATIAHPEAKLTASLRRIPLIDFRATATRRGGVRARLTGGAGHYPHAFIATMRSGHRGVFQRVDRARLPIRELHGPSLGHVFAKYRAAALARAEESFRTNLDHELSRLRD